jgi:hypothetical protein
MGIELTTPTPIEVVHNQAIVNFELRVPHAETVPDEINIVKENIELIANIATWNENEVIMDTATMVIPFADIPTAGRTALKDVYGWLEVQAQAQGLIGAGTPEPIE